MGAVFIGYRGENDVREVRIPVEHLMAEFPGMQIYMSMVPVGGVEDDGYLLDTELDGNELVWHVHAADVVADGTTKASIRMTDGDGRVALDHPFEVIISANIGADGETPEVYIPWIDKLAVSVAKAEEAAANANAAVENVSGAISAKLDKSGHTPKVYLVTDENGNVAERKNITAEDVGALPKDAQIPSKTSELLNDSGFITALVDDLVNYYKKNQIYTKDEVDRLVSLVPTFSVEVVTSLPSTNISHSTLYLLKGDGNTGTRNLYSEFLYVNNQWEMLGAHSLEVNLDDYAKIEWVNAKLGDYMKKNELPEFPTKLSQLAEDADHRTVTDGEKALWSSKSNFSGEYKDLVGAPDIPTRVGELANDSGFVTKAVADLANYYLKTETYTREEINQRISSIPKFNISVVSSLPTSNISETTIYLVGGGEAGNLYTEYIRVNGAWEVLGSQRVDLTGYATETWVVGQLAGYQPKGNYALKSELPDVPVQSVNNKTGDVKLNASDVGADPSGTAENAVSTHNQSETAHQDIRRAVSQLSADIANKVTSPSVAEVGQVIAVKAVDSDGRPTEWEAVDMAAGGGVTSWNDLPDRPFGETYGDTLTWDNTFGVMDKNIGLFTKISDAVPTINDVKNGVILDYGEGFEFSGEEAQSFFTDDGFANMEFIIIVPQDNYAANVFDVDTVFPEKGVYILIELFGATITFPGYTGFISIEEIDEKYIPDMGWSKTVVLYVKYSEDVARLFKDADLTEAVTSVEMYQLIRERVRVVIEYSENETSEAVYLHAEEVGYFNSSGEWCIAYTTE